MSKHRGSAVQSIPTSATLAQSLPLAFPQNWFLEAERLRAQQVTRFRDVTKFTFLQPDDAAMTFEEIGRRLNCSPSHAKYLFARGMRKLCRLQKELAPLYELAELHHSMGEMRAISRDGSWHQDREEEMGR